MSQARVFTLLGDSNVSKNINKTTCRANPVIRSAQILTCGHLGIFRESIQKMRPESNTCILSCLTNFLTGADGPDSVSQRIDPVLQEIQAILFDVCKSSPEKLFLISPPMYRASPVWYREGLPEVLTTFSQVLNQDKPPNLLIMSSFPTPSFQADGVHLTPYSGLEFLIHLFDGATESIERLSLPPEAGATKACESTRVLEDRVMALEQDHRRLNRVVEHKIAIDSEEADFRENVSHLDTFMLAGVPLLPQDLVGKPWQDQAQHDVQDFIKKLMGKELPIVFVSNATQRYKDAEVTYAVRMKNISDSKAIRDKFGSFFLGGKVQKPEAMKPYSVRNRVTPATTVRRVLLQVLARRYKASNPGSKVQVIGYEPRPKLKITPAPTASDKRIKNYFFVEAVRTLPTNFTDSELEFIYKRVSLQFLGKVRSLFICLSDDEFKKHKNFKKAGAAAEAGAGAQVEPESSAEVELASESEASPDPPSRQGTKRGADAPPEDAGPAKK